MCIFMIIPLRSLELTHAKIKMPVDLSYKLFSPTLDCKNPMQPQGHHAVEAVRPGLFAALWR
jgi:hypothetical protein